MSIETERINSEAQLIQLANMVDRAFELPETTKTELEIAIQGQTQAELDTNIHIYRHSGFPGLKALVAKALCGDDPEYIDEMLGFARKQAVTGHLIAVSRKATREIMNDNWKSNF